LEKNESDRWSFNERYQQEARKMKVYSTKILRGYGKSRPVKKEEYEVKRINCSADFLFRFHDDSVTWLCFFGYDGASKITSFYPLSEKQIEKLKKHCENKK
jgi:hypothetical protein